MIVVSNKKASQFSGDLLVFFVRQSEKKRPPVCSDKLVQERIDHAFELGDCQGKKEECLLIYPERVFDGVRAKRLLIVGLGGDELSRELFRRVGGVVAQKALALKAEKLFLVVPEELPFSASEMAECLSEGLILGAYRFRKYIKEEDDEKQGEIKRISLSVTDSAMAHVRKAVKRGVVAADAGIAVRNMANEPGNVWIPQAFAEYGRKIAEKGGIVSRILDVDEMQQLKMEGILGVGQGSAHPPKLVILEYRTGKNVPTLLLVGKGITFDSGGVSLKSGENMGDMKYDMCGGAAVMAAMEAVAEEKPGRLDIVALIPAAENLPSSTALKPGDIITQYGGKTVEVLNTDAEGRLILADALAYGVEQFKPDAVIDVATLTGAVIIGLGHHRTGLLSNNDELSTNILAAGERAGEPLWRLPLADEYREQLKSQVADLKNIGGRAAGTITAAAFLQEFVGKIPWAHLDIAGTAWNYTEKPYIPKGPSGIAARTLIEFIRSWK